MSARRRRWALAVGLVLALAAAGAAGFAVWRRGHVPRLVLHSRLATPWETVSISLVDGGRLALLADGGAQQSLEAWSLADGTLVRQETLPAGERIVRHARHSDRLLLARPGRFAVVSAWTGKTLAERPLDPLPGTLAVAISHSGDLVATAVAGGVEVRDALSGKLLKTLALPSDTNPEAWTPAEIIFWPDDAFLTLVLATHNQGAPRELTWDLARGELIAGSSNGLPAAGGRTADFRESEGVVAWHSARDGQPLREVKIARALALDEEVKRYDFVEGLIVVWANDAWEAFSAETGARLGGRPAAVAGRFIAGVDACGEVLALHMNDGTVEIWDLAR